MESHVASCQSPYACDAGQLLCCCSIAVKPAISFQFPAVSQQCRMKNYSFLVPRTIEQYPIEQCPRSAIKWPKFVRFSLFCIDEVRTDLHRTRIRTPKSNKKITSFIQIQMLCARGPLRWLLVPTVRVSLSIDFMRQAIENITAFLYLVRSFSMGKDKLAIWAIENDCSRRASTRWWDDGRDMAQNVQMQHVLPQGRITVNEIKPKDALERCFCFKLGLDKRLCTSIFAFPSNSLVSFVFTARATMFCGYYVYTCARRHISFELILFCCWAIAAIVDRRFSVEKKIVKFIDWLPSRILKNAHRLNEYRKCWFCNSANNAPPMNNSHNAKLFWAKREAYLCDHIIPA